MLPDRLHAAGLDGLTAHGDDIEVGAAVHAAGDLHAETVHHEGRGKNAGDAERDSAGLNHPVADAQVAMTLVERGVDLDPVMAGIVRVGLAASDAGSAGLI